MKRKQRLSASVDADLMAAVEAATRRRGDRNVSSWVSDALRLKLEHDRRLEALASFIDAYEAEHGEITPAEIAEASRRTRARSLPVRTLKPETPSAGKRRRAG